MVVDVVLLVDDVELVEEVEEVVLDDVELEVDEVDEDEVLELVDELDELLELDELELLEELEVDELVDVRRTSGPATAHCDSARTMSTTPSSPPRPGNTSMCAARTMMLELTPGMSAWICSFSVTRRTPGISITVLAAGDVRIGLPLRTPPTISVKPVEPLPSLRHPLSATSRVMALRPTMTSATLARLSENPRWPVGSPAAMPSPWVKALRAPTNSRPGRLIGMADWLVGPKLFAGSVAVPDTSGLGAMTWPSRLDCTVAP
jgi:hypothetical protein